MGPLEQRERRPVAAPGSEGNGWDRVPGLPSADESRLGRATVALVQSRFSLCEALLEEEASPEEPRAAATLLLARLRRDQGYPAEAEVLARGAAGEHPDPVAGALLAAILGDLGRDAEAGRRLRALAAADFSAVTGRRSWLVSAVALSELCWVTRATSVASDLAALLLADAGRMAFAPDGAGWAGSVSRSLGLLAAAVGDWDAAAAYLEAGLDDHVRAGAPMLVANTRRELAAVLRARGQRGDWERGFDLLSGAESIYRRVGAVSLGEAARVLLQCAEEHRGTAGANVLFRAGDRWWFGPPDAPVAVRDGPGLTDLSTLLARPGQRVHVGELFAASAHAAGPDGGGDDEVSPGCADPRGDHRLPGARRMPDNTEPCGETEERRRIDALEAEQDRAGQSFDLLGSSLASAEREYLVSQLAARPSFDELDRVRSTVSARLRLSIDRLEQAHPALGRHLRHSVQVDTFCCYEPVQPMSWRLW